MAVLILW